MDLNDYGTMHLLHQLRLREIQRKRRGLGYDFAESEPRPNGLVTRIQRLLRRNRPASYVTSYTTSHPSSRKTSRQPVEASQILS